MSDAFDILGVTANCSIDDAKSAYRRLAMKHHPDRGGDKQVFQRIQTAWEQIERGYKRQQKHQNVHHSAFAKNQYTSRPTSFNTIYDSFKTSGMGANAIVHVSVPPIAFGRQCTVFINGHTYVIKEPIPHNWFGTIEPDSESMMPGQSKPPSVKVQVGLKLPRESMEIQGLYSSASSFSQLGADRLAFTSNIGDVVDTVETNAVNLITGGWHETIDVFGNPCKFRIPAGFDPNRRLRVAGAGYYKYDTLEQKILAERADLIIELKPMFTTLEKMSKPVLDQLKKAIESV